MRETASNFPRACRCVARGDVAYWTMQKFSTEYPCHVQLIRRVASASVSLLTGWFMIQRLDVARRRDILARWCNLAEQRLQHLTELFETGRWRRYHSERAFLENIQEAKSAVEIWRGLSMREASFDNEAARANRASRGNAAADVSRPGHTRVTLPRGEARRDPVRPVLSPPLSFPAAARPARLPIPPAAVRISSNQAPSVPAIDPPVVERGPLPSLDSAPELLDIAAMQKRYPLLRNAL
jgi:uncharacterized repeat protein (TIGR03809 family)